ncbi:DegV family protein [Clostridium botulinum]|uniref:EDD, DegV family domain protein n=1 Tax=Clostridium sporogenes TaxID=1509 RepID=A0A1J1CUP8_CLOSG|nr:MULTISPECIES: DegV family protein [Clostridium]APF25784.1 EDD, DegV family domain protein [Clostridium sporogenes]APH16914.1 EDD, DegV family domain protein [Clostridium sporogenes]MDI6918312.1 DegV family protein [Clostridium botulinum]WMU98291.1 DegV family protein [Clostridium botulinum]
MEKIALITDTTSDLPEDILEKYNIKQLAFRIIYKDRELKDRFDISSKEVYENLEVEVPTSSLPSMEDMDNLFTQLEGEGYTHVIAVVLSSGLSGIYNGMKIVSENHPKLTTYICDSKSISLGEGVLLMESARMLEEGKSFNEIVEAIPKIRENVKTFFVVGTLEYLKKGGRIGKVAGTIAELLNIKPIISIDNEDGKYYTYTKVRGRKQSLAKLIDIAKEFLEKGKCKIYVLHGNAEEEAKTVFEVLKNLPNVTFAMLGGCISPVSGAHSGPGLVGVACLRDMDYCGN